MAVHQFRQFPFYADFLCVSLLLTSTPVQSVLAAPEPSSACADRWLIVFLGTVAFFSLVLAVMYRRLTRCMQRQSSTNLLFSAMRDVLDASPNSVVLTDLNGIVIFANAVHQHLQHRTASELLGTSIYAYLPEDSAERRRQAVEGMLRSGHCVTYEDLFHDRRIETHICPVRDQDGTIIKIGFFCVDITSRHATEQQLRDSEEKFQAIANYTVDGESWYGPDGSCRWMNPGVEKLTGYPPAKFRRNPEFLLDMLHPDDRAQGRRLFLEALKGSSGENVELRCIRADGTEIWMGVSWQAMYNHGDEFLGTRISARDISPMKRIEEQLSLQSLVLDQIRDTVTVTDLDGIILYVNQAELITFQRSLDDLIGQPIALYGQDRQEIQDEIISQTLRNEEWQGKLLRRDDHGDMRVFTCRTTLVRDKLWRPIGMCSVAMDITDQEQTQQDLRDSEERFRGVFETSPTGIVLAEADTLRLLRANPSFLDIIGYTENELPALTVAAITHPDDWVKEQRMVEAGRDRTGRQFVFEKRFVRKDGDIRWVRVSGAYLQPADGNPLVIGTVTDITERKQAEADLCASLQEKEILLREVHHRVKNNLAAIIGLLDIQAHAQKDPVVTSILHELGGRIRSMSLIHENLYQSETMAEIDFQIYTRNLIDNLLVSFGSTAVSCVVDMQDVTLPLDQALPCGMILNELITNVFKYAFPDKSVVPESPAVTISLRADEDVCTLSVSDNGVGLPPDFDWKKAQSLGMVLVRTLGCHQLGGNLDFQTGNGTSCTLSFHRKRRSSHDSGNNPACRR